MCVFIMLNLKLGKNRHTQLDLGLKIQVFRLLAHITFVSMFQKVSIYVSKKLGCVFGVGQGGLDEDGGLSKCHKMKRQYCLRYGGTFRPG